MASASDTFFRTVALSDLTLRVGDLATVATFYRDLLGFRTVSDNGTRIAFSPTGNAPALVVLEAAAHAPRRPAGSAGLFHAAFLLPDRAALGRIAVRLRDHGVPLGGADHGVSEALYLHDPEGNGVELYADRPAEAWPHSATPGQVAMITAPLDFASLAAAGASTPGPTLPAGTRLGHVHLSVSQLDHARAFYAGALEFAVRQQDYPGALFLGRDGYHHHLAVNTWRSQRPATPGALGLARFTIRLADAAEYARVVRAARDAQRLASEASDHAILRDPDGIEIELHPMAKVDEAR